MDPDAYDKLVSIRSERRRKAPGARATWTDVLTDVLHQFIKKHGTNIPRKKRLSIAVRANLALTLRMVALKLHITETDILSTAIREFDEETHKRECEEFMRQNDHAPRTFDVVSDCYEKREM